MALFRRRFGFAGATDAQLAAAIVRRVVEEIADGALLFPGALEALEFCEARGLSLALASGSVMEIIEAVLDRFDLRRHFPVVVSAERVPLGKPHPGVLLLTAEELGADPLRCVVVEDAVNGCIAAKAARMAVIGVPEPGTEGDPRWAIADVVLESLVDFPSAPVAALLDDVTRAERDASRDYLETSRLRQTTMFTSRGCFVMMRRGSCRPGNERRPMKRGPGRRVRPP